MDDLLAKAQTLQQLPDQALAQLMQGGPGTSVPPFLVLGEIQRRKDLRASAQPAPPAHRTVAEEAMSGMAGVQHFADGGRVGGMPNLYDPEYRRWWEEQVAAVPSLMDGIGGLTGLGALIPAAEAGVLQMPPRMEPGNDTPYQAPQDVAPRAKRVEIIPREGPSVDWEADSRMPGMGAYTGYVENQGPPTRSDSMSLWERWVTGGLTPDARTQAAMDRVPLEALEANPPPSPGMPSWASAAQAAELPPPEEPPTRGLAAVAGNAAVPGGTMGGAANVPSQEAMPQPRGLSDFLAQAQQMNQGANPQADPYAEVKARLAAMDKRAADQDENALADFAIQAGLAMMSSRNPNFLGAIGEGGLVGFEDYLKRKRGREEGEMERLQIGADLEARRQAAEAAARQGNNTLALGLMQEDRLSRGQAAEAARAERGLGLEERKLGILASRANRAATPRMTDGQQFVATLMAQNPGMTIKQAWEEWFKIQGKGNPLADLMQQQSLPTEDDLMDAL